MSRKRKEPTKWDVLRQFIVDYAEWCRADEMKGGGDPLSIPEIEASLSLARAKLEAHIAKMIREEESA